MLAKEPAARDEKRRQQAAELAKAVRFEDSAEVVDDQRSSR